MTYTAANNTVPIPVTELVGKMCYAKPMFSEWFWPRKIAAVREIEQGWNSGTKYQVSVRNWFWHEWVNLCDVRVEHWRYPK